jgi:hypothetical protein
MNSSNEKDLGDLPTFCVIPWWADYLMKKQDEKYDLEVP